ncbi:MAG: YqaJ viral recombinase family protein [Alphaproteobacteria bacterium]|nr:YqaJ viral recombinase family protein [Alphaproteobacteria bacterium]
MPSIPPFKVTMPDLAAEHLTGIGGSQSSIALGCNPWQSRHDLWLEKTGLVTEPIPVPPEVEEIRYWGNLMEPILCDEFRRRTGKRVVKPTDMLRHPEYPFMIAHLDGIDIDDPRRIVEIKTARSPRGWGESGSNEIPLHYLVQVQHYLIVTGREVASVAALIGGNDFRIFEVPYDARFAEEIIEAERAFWELVVRREPPEPVTLGDMIKRWGRAAAEDAVLAGREEIEAVRRMIEVRDQIKYLEIAETEARAVCLRALADRGDVLVNAAGVPLVSWRLDNGRKEYTVAARSPARRFLLKATKDTILD